jgi:hypothetical protein
MQSHWDLYKKEKIIRESPFSAAVCAICVFPPTFQKWAELWALTEQVPWQKQGYFAEVMAILMKKRAQEKSDHFCSKIHQTTLKTQTLHCERVFWVSAIKDGPGVGMSRNQNLVVEECVSILLCPFALVRQGPAKLMWDESPDLGESYQLYKTCHNQLDHVYFVKGYITFQELK